MRRWIGASAISRLAGVMITAWLCGMGPAWAGGGGSDGGVSQPFLTSVCDVIGVPAGSCPQPPTLTQIVLGIAGYQNTPPDFVRGPLGIFAAVSGLSTGTLTPLCSVSGNFGQVCSEFNAVTTVNQLAPSSIELTDLPNLTPLAFVAASGKAVTPVALGSPGANSFLYPVLTGPEGQHTLNVVLDYTQGTSKSLVNGQVGSFKFPLVILNSDKTTETAVIATLNLSLTCPIATLQGQQGQQGQQQNGRCLSATVTGIPGTNSPLSAAQLGIQFGLQVAPSPNSSTPHAIFTFQLPVIVTLATDPVYFGVNNSNTPTFINQFSGQPTAFLEDDVGFTPTLLGRPIGVSPYPAPLCPASGCVSTTPPAPTFYGFCATIAGTPGTPATPAAATFLSIGTEGTVYASSPVGQQPQCP